MSRVYWVILGLIVVIIAYGVIVPRYNMSKIENCSVSAQAMVKSIKRLKGKTPKVQYEFVVDGKTYSGSKTVKNKNQLYSLEVGESVKIKYECSHPSNNVIE